MSTQLDRTAVREIAEIVKDGQKLAVTTVPAEPAHIYYLSKPDGTVNKVEAELPAVNDKLADPYEMLSYLKDFERRAIRATDGLIIASNTALEYRYELKGSFNRAAVPMHLTAGWQAVSNLWNNGQGTAMSQADLYRLLRVTLKGTLSQGNSLPNIVRAMKWESGSSVESTIDQSRKTLGVSLASEVKARDGVAIPESFEVTLDVFKNFSLPVTINIDLDTLPDRKQFLLTPYPGEIERSMQKTLEEITAVYDGVKVPAFIGEYIES